MMLLFSCFTVSTAVDLNESADTMSMQETTQITTVENNDINNQISNDNLKNENLDNSDLDTSNSVTRNIGEINTSQTSSNTTTNNIITTDTLNKTNTKINKINNTKTLKTETPEYTVSSWNEFINTVRIAQKDSIIHFRNDIVYQITDDTRFWDENTNLRNLTLLGHGAVIEGNHKRFLEIGGNRDAGIFFTLNISDFIFKNCGYFNGMATNQMGGVIYGIHKPTVYVSNCTFINSSAGAGGGAILIHRGNLTVKDSVFIDTNSTMYGTIRVATDYANLTVDNVTFMNNFAKESGATIYADTAGEVVITNTQFINATVTGDPSKSKGSAVYISSASKLYLENNTFINNTADLEGTVYIHNSLPDDERTIINNTFTNNNASDGGAIYARVANKMLIENNTFTNNTAINSQNTGMGGAINLQSNIKVTLNNNTFENNSAYNGGSIYSNAIVTSIDNKFTGNNATLGGAISLNRSTSLFDGLNDIYERNTAQNGGSVYVSSNAQLISTNGTFKSNNATLGGVFYIDDDGRFDTNYDICENNTAVRGGVFYVNHTSRAVEAEGSNYTNNKATEYGGVIYIESGTVDSEDETYLNNTAVIGGAIYNLNGTLDSINNKLINNTAVYGGSAFNSENATLIKKEGVDINNSALIGGAIYNNGTLTSTGSTFESNNATTGGAIFNNGKSTITGDLFIKNNATDGGAVYNNATMTSASNNFTANNATNGGGLLDNGTLSGTGNNYYNNTALENGGAVYSCSNNRINIERIEFNGNVAGQNGGAIYAEDNITIQSSHDVKYINNTAVNGGAIYLSNSSNISTSQDEFISNNAVNGGAIYASANNTVTVKLKTVFDLSNATNGAAIYLSNNTSLNSSGSIYKNGNATNGAVIYADKESNVSSKNDEFILNNATYGALYLEEDTVTNLSEDNFTNNTAIKGAVIYAKSDLNTSSSNFADNKAETGGAIYLDDAEYSSEGDSFTSNKATDGGVLYLSGQSVANITSSTFTTNNADNAGVSYLESGSTVISSGSTYRQNNATNGGVYYVSENSLVNITGQDRYTTNNATYGGVIYNKANVTSEGSVYTKNTATDGGVIYNDNGATFTSTKDEITSNKASNAIILNNGNSTLIASTLYSNEGETSVIENNNELTLIDNDITSNFVTNPSGYVITNNVVTATIFANTFINNTDNRRDMLLGGIQPQNITDNTYVDNYLNDTMEVPELIELPLGELESYIDITLELNSIYNDTIRNGTVYFYDSNFRKVGEGLVVDGVANVRVLKLEISESVTPITVVYNSLSKHYQDMTAKSEIHNGKTTKITIDPIDKIYVDDKVDVKVSLYDVDGLKPLYDADITVNIDGTEYTGNTATNGYIIIPDVSFSTYGNKKINATFGGNSTHINTTTNGIIEVIKVPTHLSLAIPSNVTHPDNQGYINVTLYDSRDNTTLSGFNINLDITGKEYYTDESDENGNISYLFEAYENGHIQVIASVTDINDKYANPSEINDELFIQRYHTYFHSQVSSIVADEDTTITFTLYDEYDNILGNKAITLEIDDGSGIVTTTPTTTDNEGKITITQYVPVNSNIKITASCVEDYKYRNSSLPVNLIAGKISTWISVRPTNTYVNQTNSYEISLHENDNDPISAWVTLKVEGYDSVDVYVENGETTYVNDEWTWPERSLIQVDVEYEGDDTYIGVKSQSTFTVFRAGTNTTIDVLDNLDTKTVIVGNVTSDGYLPINKGEVVLVATYTDPDDGEVKSIDLGTVNVINGTYNLTTIN